MSEVLPTVVVLGASGLIGEAVASRLSREGFPIVPIARRFTMAQKNAFGSAAVESPDFALETESLSKILAAKEIDIVVNCVGVLQDGLRGTTDLLHRVFVERLLACLRALCRPALLIHISMLGADSDAPTAFSRTKREGERLIVGASLPYVILRPGFVIAPTAYGGSALMRALALLPFDLSQRESGQVFAATDMNDITQTIVFVAHGWGDGKRDWNDVWDVTARQPALVGDVIGSLRRWLGGTTKPIALPAWLMDLGAKAGDLAAYLGWSPPIRSTALAEMRRGIRGKPDSWISVTGIQPASLASILQRMPASVQEKWFARLYLVKPLIVVALAIFWAVSGLIALTAGFDGAARILTAHGFSPTLAKAITAASSALDISIGLAIAFRRTCRIGLFVG